MPSTDAWAELPRHGPHCLCKPCKNLRKRAAWRPAPVERVYSDEASRHIKHLVRMGWRQTEFAEAAGVSTGSVSQAKVPGVVINAETELKILAVRPEQSRR